MNRSIKTAGNDFLMKSEPIKSPSPDRKRSNHITPTRSPVPLTSSANRSPYSSLKGYAHNTATSSAFEVDPTSEELARIINMINLQTAENGQNLHPCNLCLTSREQIKVLTIQNQKMMSLIESKLRKVDMAAMQARLSQSQFHIEQKDSKISELQYINSDLLQRLSHLSDERIGLLKHIDQLNHKQRPHDNDVQRSLTASSIKDKTFPSRMRQQYDQRMKTLQTQLETQIQEISFRHEGQLANLNNHLDSLFTKVFSLERVCAANNNLQGRKNTIQASPISKHKEIQSILFDEAEQSKHNQTQAEMELLKKQINSLTQLIKDRDQKIDLDEQNMAMMRNDMHSKEQRITNLQNSLKNGSSARDREIDDLSRQKAWLEEQLEEMRGKFSALFQTHQETKTQMEQLVDNYTKTISTLNAKVQSKDKQLDRMQANFDQGLQEGKSVLSLKITQLEQAQKTLQEKMSLKENDNRELMNERQRLIIELEHSSRTLSSVQVQNAKEQHENATLRQEITRLHNQLFNSENKGILSRSRLEAAEAELTSVHTQLHSLKIKFSNLQASFSQRYQISPYLEEILRQIQQQQVAGSQFELIFEEKSRQCELLHKEVAALRDKLFKTENNANILKETIKMLNESLAVYERKLDQRRELQNKFVEEDTRQIISSFKSVSQGKNYISVGSKSTLDKIRQLIMREQSRENQLQGKLSLVTILSEGNIDDDDQIIFDSQAHRQNPNQNK